MGVTVCLKEMSATSFLYCILAGFR